MGNETAIQRTVVSGMTRMTSSETVVKTLLAQGLTDVFGIVGSAYIDVLDIFPAAGIRFIPVAHEQGAVHMAGGFLRVSGRHSRATPASYEFTESMLH